MAKVKHNYKYHYIYETYDVKYDKYYIGKKSTDVDVTIVPEADGYYGSNEHIKNIVAKYKKENLDINQRLKKRIIEFNSSYEENKQREKELVDINIAKSEEYYNIAPGGDGGNTLAGYTEEEMLRTKNKRRNNSAWKDKTGEKHPTHGKPKSEETRRKLSEAKKGKHPSEETKKKLSKNSSKSKPIIVFKENKFHGEYPSAFEFSKEIGAKYPDDAISRGVRALANGLIPTKGRFVRWKVYFKEDYEKLQQQAN